MRITVFVYVFGVAMLLNGTPSAAQSSGFALSRFDVAEVGSDWFTGDSLDLRGHLRLGLGLTVDWSHRPLIEYNARDEPVVTLVKDQVYAHLGTNLILGDRIRLGLDVPVLFYQEGTDVLSDDVDPDVRVNLGDVRLAGDLRLFGEYGDLATMVAGVQLHLPTGSRESFLGDGMVRIVPRIMLAGDIDTLAYSARLSFIYRPQNDGFADVETGSELALVLTAGVRLFEKRLLLGPELWGSTVISRGATVFDRGETPFEVLFGGHYCAGQFTAGRCTGGLRFGAGVGPGLNRGVGASEYRVVGSVSYVVEHMHDRDSDSIADELDACPDLPGVPSDDPKKHGCPPDRDGDGIYDNEDACPDVPGPPNEDPKKHGCPPDRDGDGIPDAEDACPDVPGVRSNDPSRNGCPDSDGDGIFDRDDACPNRPGVPDEDPKKNGCPPDRDGDGIWDPDDACPDIAGLPNEDPRLHGCPIAHVEDNQIRIYQRIEFEFDKATLLASSEVVLTAVLEILQQHPELTEVMVEGHCDEVGTHEYNRRLSQRRATTVVKWLWARGVERLRLRPVGRGKEEPLVSNDTAVGRQKNRRVEFHILTINGEPVPGAKAVEE